MSLIERFSEYVRACFTGLWIECHEHQDALMAIALLCRQEHWRLATWDIEQGFLVDGAKIEANGSDPLAAIRSVSSLATSEDTAILVLQNFHRFLQSAEIVQAPSQQVIAGKQNGTIVVVLSPVVQLPVELEKLFVVLEHELPDRAQLSEIARGIATEASELPARQELATVLDAAAGLTRLEAENAFSLSLVRHGRILVTGRCTGGRTSLAAGTLAGSRGSGVVKISLTATRIIMPRALRGSLHSPHCSPHRSM